jgi:hypothetical protein
MTTMHPMQNAETIDRLVEQGECLLKTFHAEYQKNPAGCDTEFLRGNLAGWRSTLHTLYRDCAEEIVDRVVAKTYSAIPDGHLHSEAPSRESTVGECLSSVLIVTRSAIPSARGMQERKFGDAIRRQLSFPERGSGTVAISSQSLEPIQFPDCI